jgi:hypothetical protein
MREEGRFIGICTVTYSNARMATRLTNKPSKIGVEGRGAAATA